MANIQVVHGPNLNLLGRREPEVYGSLTLDEINHQLKKLGAQLNHQISTFQSNHEGTLIDHIQGCQTQSTDFIIFNPAGYTHSSIALRDALLAVNKPFIEVHLSNIYRREPFRRHSYFSDIAVGIISGLGAKGYQLALRYADHYLTQKS